MVSSTATKKRSARARKSASRRKVHYAVLGLGHIVQAAVLPAFEHAKRKLVSAESSSED